MNAPANFNRALTVPKFYFDVHDGTEIRDNVGRDLAGRETVREEALQVATRLLAAESADSRETTLVLTVRDEAGDTPLRIRVVSQVEEDWSPRAR